MVVIGPAGKGMKGKESGELCDIVLSIVRIFVFFVAGCKCPIWYERFVLIHDIERGYGWHFTIEKRF